MPITRRQFELGINDDVQQLMEQAYDFLFAHKDQAHSVMDLMDALGLHSVLGRERVTAALDTLAKVGVAEVRTVRGERYYAFQYPANKKTWELG